MTTWVSHATAAQYAGVSTRTLEDHLDEIRHRAHHGNRPGVDLDSALAWAATRPARSERAPRPEPVDESAPDDGDVWLDTTTAGLVLGCTPVYVARLADHEQIPAVRRGRRWWLRRRHVEQRAAARAFAALRGTARDTTGDERSCTMPEGYVETFHKDGKWHNRIEGHGTIGGEYHNRADAVLIGREEARARKVEHIVHNLDGTIGQRNSYGNDPRDIPG